MNFDRVLGVTGWIFGIAPYVALLIRWGATRRPAHRLLQLHRDRPIEVIVSTSGTKQASPGEAKSYTTAIGELRAIAVGARTILRLYKHKKPSMYMSEEYSGRLEGDVLLLGGPLRNSYSQRLLDLVNKKYPSAGLMLETRQNLIGVAGQQFNFDQGMQKGIPQRDLALLLIVSNPWDQDRRQRLVLCAGLSTYGTEGAARFLFQKVLGASREAAHLRRLLSGRAAAALVHVTLEHGRVLRTELHQGIYWSAERKDGARVSAPAVQHRRSAHTQ